MPIRFRCTYCNRRLGIATRKAGTDTTCPHCGYTITVPDETEADNKTTRVNLDDVAELLENVATERIPEPITKTVPFPRHRASRSRVRHPNPATSDRFSSATWTNCSVKLPYPKGRIDRKRHLHLGRMQ